MTRLAKSSGVTDGSPRAGLRRSARSWEKLNLLAAWHGDGLWRPRGQGRLRKEGPSGRGVEPDQREPKRQQEPESVTQQTRGHPLVFAQRRPPSEAATPTWSQPVSSATDLVATPHGDHRQCK